MAGKKIFTDHEYQTSAHLVTPKVHSVSNISSHAGVLGQLAASGNNLYFHDGSNWFSLIESNYAGALTGRPNFDPSSGNVPFTVGSGHNARVDNLNADLLDGYDSSTTAVASKIPVYGTSGVLKVGTPVATGDATTKAYVDDLVQGLDIKGSVAAASTANLTLSGTQTVDGVSLSAGNRVLVKDQSTASQNGIYIVASGSWSLASDSDAGSLTEGAYVFVEGGTVNNNTGWTFTDSSSYTWAQFSGAGQLNAGDGLVKSGDTLNANVAAPISIVSDQLTIADGAITGAKLANNTVTSTQLADSIQVSTLGIGAAAAAGSQLHITADTPIIRMTDGTSNDNHYFTGNNGELRLQSSGFISIRPNNTTTATFESAGDVTLANKLGIGGSPTYDIHVQRMNARIAADNGTVETLLQADSTIGYVGTNTNHKLILKTNNTSRLEIENDGDVKVVGKLGVNTSPISLATATVNGTLQATFGHFTGWAGNSNTGTGLGVDIGISSGDGYVLAYNRTTGSWADLRLISNGSQIHMSTAAGGSIEMSGLVGIGVTPDTALDIQGSTNLKTKIRLTNTNPSTDNIWSIHANYNDQTLHFMGDSTLALKLDDSGQVTVGNLPTSTADNSLIVESSGLLKKRTANSGIWTTNLGANRFLVSNSSGVITSDSRFVHLAGRVSLTGAIDGNANLKVDIVDHDVSSNDTNHEKAIFAYAGGGYNIASGVTDSGYRIAVDASTFVSDSDFQGTLTYQYAVMARHGAYVSASGSTITNSYGVYIDSLTNSNTTITNLWGLYQEDSAAKNYFAGSVGIGATPDNIYKLIVAGKSKLQNDIVFSSANPRIDFASTSAGIRLHSTTSNAEKLRLTDSGLKLADISTSTTDTNVIVESSGLLKKRETHPGAFATTLTQGATNLNSVSGGWHKWGSSGTKPVNSPNQYMVMLQHPDTNRDIQLAYGGSGYGKLFIRRKDNGTYYDWTEFYSTENLTLSTLGGVGGSGTVGKIPLWSGNTTTLGDSVMTQNGTDRVTVGGGLVLSGNYDDTGSQLNLWCNSSGHGYAAVFDFALRTGSNSNRTTKWEISNTGAITSGPTGYKIKQTYSNSNNSALLYSSTTGNFELRGSETDYAQLYLKSGGNVGIGIDVPDLKLDVQATSAQANLGVKRTDGSWATLYGGSSFAGLVFDNSGYFKIAPGPASNRTDTSGNGLIIDDSGNVGINGTPSTSYKLDVNGDAMLQSSQSGDLQLLINNISTSSLARSALLLKNNSGSTAGLTLPSVGYTSITGWANRLILNTDSNISNGILVRPSNGGFTVSTTGLANSDLFVEDDTGNVGINCTPNANYKLDVDGAGRFTTSLRSDGYLTIASNTAELYIANAAISKFWRQRLSANGTEYNLLFDYNDGAGNITPLTLSNTGHATFSGTITSTNNANGSGDNIVVSTTNKDAALYAISSKRSGTTVGGMRIDGRFRATSGSSTSPSYSFTDDSNTGMFRAGSDHLQLVSGGTGRLKVTADVSVIGSTDLLITGANRRLSFTSGTGTVRTTTAADLYLATNNTNRVQVTSGGAVKATRDGGSNLIQVARIHDGSLTGNGTATSFTITHNLETAKPIAVVIDHTSGAYVEAQIVVASDNAITVTFNNPPASGKVYRVPVTG